MLRPGRDVVLLQAINLIYVTDRLPFNLYIAVRRKSIVGKDESSIIVKKSKLHEITFKFIITYSEYFTFVFLNIWLLINTLIVIVMLWNKLHLLVSVTILIYMILLLYEFKFKFTI